jgi:hypothetical protein
VYTAGRCSPCQAPYGLMATHRRRLTSEDSRARPSRSRFGDTNCTSSLVPKNWNCRSCSSYRKHASCAVVSPAADTPPPPGRQRAAAVGPAPHRAFPARHPPPRTNAADSHAAQTRNSPQRRCSVSSHPRTHAHTPERSEAMPPRPPKKALPVFSIDTRSSQETAASVQGGARHSPV